MTSKILHMACLALAVTACNDSTATVTPDGPTVTPDAAGPPAKPTLGAQIDRMGRPAINTALDKTFSVDATRDPAEDAYNGDTAKATWPATYTSIFAAQLAILDSIDRVCGNQVFAGSGAVAGRYNTLAGALADDQLYVNSAGTTCGQYLAVEANATNLLANDDCGGRKLEFDVIETTYSALVAGALTGIDDGVTNDSTFKATFPYLGDANP
jgi:hypothetical protein